MSTTGWFKQLCWIILLFAAAVCVSCQELTSTLRDGSHACRGEEVTFTCTVRGSIDVPHLILAWSSTEYIGQGNRLPFTTDDVPGANRTSIINKNVTATLTSNTTINGVPVLVSELRIITTNRSSTVGCRSVTTSSMNTTVLNVSDAAVPEAPLNVGATAVLQLSESDCEIVVKWDPPANSVDITNYLVYVPALNMNVTTNSFILSLPLRDCPKSFGVKVAAMNRFGCIGINSSEVNVTLTPQSTSGVSTSPATSESSQFSAGDIAGIVIGSTIFFFLVILVIVAVLCGYIIILRRKKEIMSDAGEDDTHDLLPPEEEQRTEHTLESQRRASFQAKDCYQKQSQHDFDKLGTEEDRVSVPIWIDDKLDDRWKDSLHEAVKAINEAAPGLSLSITEDKKLAFIHVLATDEKEAYTEGNIQMRSTSGQLDYITKIHLGQLEDDTKEGISTRELTRALEFNQDSNLGLTRFDPRSITLYQNKEAYESARRRHSADSVWLLKQPNKENTKLSELDKVGLNLVHRPCRDTTAVNGYKPELGKTGMYYCGRRVMSDDTYPGEEYIDGFCGPDYGPNCPACRTIKSEKVKKILEGGKWQGMTGRVYCGRLFAEHDDGTCGMDNGPACSDCNDLLNKEMKCTNEDT